MKRWIAFTFVFVLVAAALIESERQKIAAPVGPEAVLSLVADTERELRRLPVAFTRLSDEDEIKIGDDLAKFYLSEERFKKEDSKSKIVQAYVEGVGARVAGRAHRKQLYKFHYISDPNFVNAFALPGGHVFIGSGLIALMVSEDELASILGHEVEHIDHYHCIERAQTEATLRKVPMGEFFAIPVEVFEAGYSKTQELEADREGTRLAVKAGYSPLGAVRIFQTFDQLYHQQQARAQTPQEELSHIALETLEGYFRSHPLPSERIAQIQTMISDEHWENLTNEQPLAVAYVFLTERAEKALAAKKYAGGESAAAKSLALRPDQPDALEVLAAAQFAQTKFPEARENYRKLIDRSPSDAGDFAKFAAAIAADALAAEHFDQAGKFASALLQLQPNNSMALVLLAEAQLATADYAGSEATYRKLKNLYPSEATDVVNYAKSLAEKSMAAHRYQQAAGVSAYWLAIDPKQEEARRTQADAELALGNFAGAAKADRALLDLTPKDREVDIHVVWSYADALSATGDPKAAVRQFQSFVAQPRKSVPALDAQINVEWAGLALMAGNSVPAQQMAASATLGAQATVAPEVLERLGWWYYRAGRYPEAETLLRSLAAQRSDNVQLQYDLGWVELEQSKADSAVVRFGIPADQTVSGAQWNTPAMGRAIARWYSHRADDALKDYASAVQLEPRWMNERMVRAFYSPRVAKSVAEMQAEQAKRLQAKQSGGPAVSVRP